MEDLELIAQQLGIDPVALFLMLNPQSPSGTTDKYGDAEPYDLDTQNKQGTLLGKQNKLLDSPLFQGAPGTYDPLTMLPDQEVEEFAGADPLAGYLQLSETSVEGYVARQVADNVAPSAIVAALRAEGAPPEDVELAQSLAPELFQGRNQYRQEVEQWAGFDESGRPAPRVKSTESEASRNFSDRGLSNPNERFTADDFAGPQAQALLERQAETQAALQQFEVEDAQLNDPISQLAAALQGQRYAGQGAAMGARVDEPNTVDGLRGNSPAAREADRFWQGAESIGRFAADQVRGRGRDESVEQGQGVGKTVTDWVTNAFKDDRGLTGSLNTNQRSTPQGRSVQGRSDSSSGGNFGALASRASAAREQRASNAGRGRELKTDARVARQDSKFERLRSQGRANSAARNGDTPYSRQMAQLDFVMRQAGLK